MKASDMKPGVRYVVTKASRGREFQKNDTVWLLADGAIACPQAEGWMPKEDLPEATRGMEVEIDTAGIEKRRAALRAELLALGGA